ncbi:hypothetical protein BDR26DRAFT_80182 [Obelidium mucronatum]|nr:hypothetical protein BDR26DRAFT_80182 [Obelidium mucronatum]
MRVKSQVLGDGNPLSRPATNINPTDTRCLRASFASYNKRCKRISLLLLIGLLVVLVAVVGRALREFERIQRLWREAATKAVNERQIQQAQTPLLFRHHWGSVLRQEYKPRTYLEHAMRIADPEIENNKCDYFNNGEFLADFLALPHLECGNSELLADTWKFGDDLAEYGETYMSKKIETGGVAAFNGWLVHMQKKLSTYMADKKKKKEFNYAEVQQENDLIEQDIHTDRGNSENQFKWRNSNTPITAEPSSKTASRIRCGTLDTNIPQRYCETRNLAIKLDLLPKMPDRRKGQDLPAIFGSMETLCHLDENSWFGRGFGGGAAGWMFDGMEVLNPKENENIQCDLW